MRRYSGKRATVASGILRPRLVGAIATHPRSLVHTFTKRLRTPVRPARIGPIGPIAQCRTGYVVSRSSSRQRRTSLPVAFFGSWSTNTTFVGHLYRARWSWA